MLVSLLVWYCLVVYFNQSHLINCLKEILYNWRRKGNEAKLKLMGVVSVQSSFNSQKIAQKVSPSSKIQPTGEPGLGSFQFDQWSCLTLFILMHLANQLMEKIQNPDSDDAGSVSSHYFSWVGHRNSIVQCAMSISITKVYNQEGETRNASCHLGNWLLLPWSSLKRGMILSKCYEWQFSSISFLQIRKTHILL